MVRHRRIPKKNRKKIKNISRNRTDTVENHLMDQPPKLEDISSQWVPRSFKEFLELKHLWGKTKHLKYKSKSNQTSVVSNHLLDSRFFIDKEEVLPGMNKPLKPIPHFRQYENETLKQFIYRVEKMTQLFLNQSKFEEKFKVDVTSNPETNQIKVKKHESGFTDSLLRKLRFSEKMEVEIKAKRNKKRKMRQKKNRARQKRGRQEKENELHPETIMFGETVHEPPKFSVHLKRKFFKK